MTVLRQDQSHKFIFMNKIMVNRLLFYHFDYPNQNRKYKFTVDILYYIYSCNIR